MLGLPISQVKDVVKQASTTESNTASIKPSTATNYDSDAALIEDNMADFNSFVNNKDEEFGFAENVVDLSTKIVPVYAQLKKLQRLQTNIA